MLPGFIGIGASLGCGELLLALNTSPEIKESCNGLVLVGSSLPIPLRTPQKPNGPPREFWDNVLVGLREDQLGWAKTGLPVVFRPDGISETEMMRYMHIISKSDPLAIERTVQPFLERDLTEVMKSLHDSIRPLEILMLQGDKDSVNPTEEGPELVKKCLPATKVVVHENGYHGELSVPDSSCVFQIETPELTEIPSPGLAQTHKERCLQDIVTFGRSHS